MWIPPSCVRAAVLEPSITSPPLHQRAIDLWASVVQSNRTAAQLSTSQILSFPMCSNMASAHVRERGEKTEFHIYRFCVCCCVNVLVVPCRQPRSTSSSPSGSRGLYLCLALRRPWEVRCSRFEALKRDSQHTRLL
jgi:hypothetical protein